MTLLRSAVLAAALVPLTGCLVLKKDYDQVVADASQQRAAADQQRTGDAARLADLQQRLTAAEAATQERDSKISDLLTSTHNLQAELDEATAINQQLRGELERLGKDADKLLSDRGTLSKALEDARARLEELRRTQEAAEARTALFRDLELRFREMIQAGQVRVGARRGQPALVVTGDLLFDEGRADLRPAGKGALLEIARALQGVASRQRRFVVTAHLDDASLKGNRRFHSSWELTVARAVTVVELFTSVGVAPDSLEATGAGAFDSLAPNDSPENRAKNRRIEIALAPVLSAPARARARARACARSRARARAHTQAREALTPTSPEAAPPTGAPRPPRSRSSWRATASGSA